MRIGLFQSISVVFVMFVLLLGGCGDSDETKSKNLLSQAETLIQQGDELQAEQLLADLVARYPETQSGATASKHLERIQAQRDLRERDLREQQEFTKVLDSYQQVLNGYHELYAGYPRSISALDQSDYFFDSAYLEGITPDGYQVYLLLKSDGSGYRLWCVNKAKDRGYAVETLSSNLVPFERDEMLKELKARFRTMTWDSKLVALETAG